MLVSMTIINTNVYILLNVIFLFSIGFMYYTGQSTKNVSFRQKKSHII